MDPLMLQKQVRDNANELNTFLNDLKSWEKDMKRKDQELLESTADNTVVPPVRSRIKRPKNTNSSVQASKISEVKRISSYDYSAWDKFDVEKACEDVDSKEQGHSDSESDVESTNTDVSQLREQALYEKELGNQHVKNQRWKEAIECYTKAIQCNPYDAVFYANRALCYLKTNQPKLAETDCTTALQLDKSYVKAYQRRALARVILALPDDAKSDFQKVLELEPNNSAAKSELFKLEKGSCVISRKKETSKTIVGKDISSNLNIGKEKEGLQKTHSVKSSKQSVPQRRLEGTPDIRGAGGDAGIQEIPCSVLRESDKAIQPFQKLPHLRSKRPLKTIPIQEVETFSDLLQSEDKVKNKIIEIKSSDFSEVNKTTEPDKKAEFEDETQELLRETSSRLQEVKKMPELQHTQNWKTIDLPSVPHTSVQFFVSWKIVKNDPELRYQFLKQIPGKELPHIFQESLESKEFTEIVSSLANEFLEKNEPVYHYLQGLSEVKRFSTLVMFMSKTEKNVIKKVLHHCHENSECTKEELTELLKRYEIN